MVTWPYGLRVYLMVWADILPYWAAVLIAVLGHLGDSFSHRSCCRGVHFHAERFSITLNNFWVMGILGQCADIFKAFTQHLFLAPQNASTHWQGYWQFRDKPASSSPQISLFFLEALCTAIRILFCHSLLRQGIVGKHELWRLVALGPHSRCSIKIYWLHNSY